MAQDQGKTSTGMQANVAALLCYIPFGIGVIASIVFVIIEKENKFVRFNALQSLFLTIALIILSFIPLVNIIIWALAAVLCIILLIKSYQGEKMKLPGVGDLAEKYA
ncbi:DUF4870 domain-containing protein [Candidatus Omnitrophota bacterium]